MERRLLFFASGLATLLLFVATVTAAPPTRIPFEFDETFPSDFLTAVCGIPVFLHVQGAGTTTLYYDKSGTQLVREHDTLAPGARSTIFSPVEIGGTGKSFTEVYARPIHVPVPRGHGDRRSRDRHLERGATNLGAGQSTHRRP